jgi:hypothetical protein
MAIMLGIVLSISSVLLEVKTTRKYERITDVLVLALFAFFENIGFRQLHAWWRLKGLIDFFKGNKEWGEMKRKGVGN